LACKYESTTVSTHKHQKIVVQASTNDLLRCLVNYLLKRCSHLIKSSDSSSGGVSSSGKNGAKVDIREIICWLRAPDRVLLTQGWQEIAFLNPVNVVFVYLLVKQILARPEQLRTVHELQCHLMTCLYLAFSYMGNEISYPLKPFLVEADNRDVFWTRVVTFMSELSASMLRVNQEPRYFTELFYELKAYSTATTTIVDNSIYSKPSVSLSSNLPKSLTINAINENKQQQQPQQQLKESTTIGEQLFRSKQQPAAEINNNTDRNKSEMIYQQQQQQSQSNNNSSGLLTFSNHTTNGHLQKAAVAAASSRVGCYSSYFASNDHQQLHQPQKQQQQSVGLPNAHHLYASYEAPQQIAYCI
jgi:hypothetical protein